MGAYKLNPKVTNQTEFKNGVGQVVLRILKTDEDKMVFVSKGNVALSQKEQAQLIDFLLASL